MKFSVLILFLSMLGVPALGSPLKPLKLDSPRDTMKSFYSAMNDYRVGVTTGNKALKNRIHDAVRCLDLSNVNPIIRDEYGSKAAIFLKEVIDRVIVLDFSLIPDSSDISRWRLKDTEITIYQIKDEKSERNGMYLFTPDTVERSEKDYATVKDLPYLDGSGQGAAFDEPLIEEIAPEWAKNKNLGLSNWQWIGIFAALLIGFILKVATEFAIIVLKKLTVRKENSVRHTTLLAMEKPMGLIAATGFWYISIYAIKLEGIALSIFLVAIKITFAVSVTWAAYNFSDVLTNYMKRVTDRTKSTLDDQLVPLLSKAMRIGIVVFGALMTIQSLGFNVMSLMAGLGLGGLAFALAAKDTAANLFGSIRILLDRPFHVGDWIKTSNAEGTVEEIGFRSTRIRTFYNSLVSVPNMEMATVAIDNMGARKYRRENVSLGVTYDTPPEKIEAFMAGIKSIILASPVTNKENFHVAFRGFGSSSLNIMVYYFVEVPDWSGELLAKQNVNLEIMRLAKRLDISFAFPTQSVFIEGMPEGLQV
ncbi:MAG: mechanosensitive ion channel [Bdellovibrionales bacterium]